MNREKHSNGLRLVCAGFVAGWLTLAAQAGKHYVPTDYPTIQAAIDAAVDGDEVCVADGTYTGPGNRDIDFHGKVVAVRSLNGRVGCTIDCQGSDLDPHRAFYFHNGETASSVLEGFTIRNGSAGSAVPFGGAVLCDGSAPLIRACRFEGNAASYGGAIYVESASTDLSLIDCTFSGNAAGLYGGALYSYSCNVSLTGCTFTQNGAVGGGGAVYDWETGIHIFTDCTFDRNSSTSPTDYGGGGIMCGGDVSAGTETLTNCRFIGNSTMRLGGGVWFRGSLATVTNCLFEGNSAVGPSSADNSGGGGVGVSRGAQATLTNCRFTANQTGTWRPGAALWVGDGFGGPATAGIVNCTFSRNMAPPGGGALAVTQTSHADVANCIFRGDIPAGIALVEAGTAGVSYCDVQGGPTGTGNINLDPLFVRNPSPGPDGVWGTPDDDYGDLRLTAGSPCIDAGDPAFAPAPCEHDLAGACRVWDGNADSTVRVDMGAYEFGAPRGDLDGDCQIGLSDLTTMLSHFGAAAGAAPGDGDLDADGDVDLSDLTILLSGFGSTCP